MNRNIRLLKISFEALKGKNIISRIFFICVIILTILPMLLQGISQSLIGEVFESKKDVYGEFTDILYLDRPSDDFIITPNEINGELPGCNYKLFGVLYSVYREKEDDIYINAGYADDNAIKLGHIKLIKGCFPKSNNEIAVTRSVIEKMKLECNLNQQIEFAAHKYKLVGIVEDYGRLWPKREQEIKAGIGPLNIFLSEEDVSKQSSVHKIIKQILLYRNLNEKVSIDNSNILSNVNNQLDTADTIFKIPAGLFIMLFLSEFFILYNVLLLSYEKTLKRSRIYGFLGMSKKNIFLCLVFELVSLLLIGLFFGIVSGLGFIILAIKIISSILSTNLSLTGLPHIFLINFIFFIITFISILIFVSQVIHKLSYNNMTSYRYHRLCRKYTFPRLVFSEFINQKKVCILLILLLGVSSAFLEFSLVYKNYFIYITSYKEYNGKMPFDYDFEFVTMMRESGEINKNAIYLDNTYEKDGLTEEMVSRIKAEKDISKILLYKENNKVRILLNKGQMDSYLDASDYVEDEQYHPLGGSNDLSNVFGYGDSVLVKTKLNGYNDDELLSFNQYVVEGKIDIEKLNSGEEVILVAPPYTLTPLNDGGIMKNWCTPSTKGAYLNKLFHVGDEITLTQLESKQKNNGGVVKETLLQSYNRNDKKVKIGAIIGSYVGWFENEATMGEAYYLFTTNQAFKNIGMETKYNRMRIYTDNGKNYDEIEGDIKSISSELPYMHLQNLRRELENYRRLKLLIELFCKILIITVGLVLTFCISSQMLFKTNLNLKKYMLLRINGLSAKQIIKLMEIQVIVFGLIGVTLSIPILFLFVHLSFHLGFYDIGKFLLSQELIGLIILLFVIFVISIIPSAVLVCRTKIKDTL